MEGCQEMGSGANGTVYRYTPDEMIKVFRAGLTLSEIEEEREAAKKAFLLGVPCAVVGARLYYVLFSWDHYAAEPVRALYVWEGGLAIYGGILGGLLAGLLYARRRRLPFLRLADLAAPCFALGQAVGRWGNFVNQEAYGAVVARSWQQALHFWRSMSRLT